MCVCVCMCSPAFLQRFCSLHSLCRHIRRPALEEVGILGGMAPRGFRAVTAAASATTVPEPDDEAGAAGDLSSLAKKVPKVKPMADQAKFQELQIQRSQLVKIIDTLQKRPDAIMMTWAWLEDHLDTSKEKSKQKESNWPESYTYIAKLPKYWMADFLVQASGGTLTSALLETMDSQDSEIVGNLFRMSCQVQKSDPMPRAALDKRVCLRMCMRRYENVGRRLSGWRDKFVRANGEVDWLRGGCYEPTFVGGRVVSVKHIGGETVAVPDYLNITDVFKIKSAWDDADACFSHGMASYRVADMFPSGTGPHKYRMGKRAVELKQMAEELKATIHAAEKDANMGIAVVTAGVTDFGKERVENKRKAALEAARAACKRMKTQKAENNGASLAPLVPAEVPVLTD